MRRSPRCTRSRGDVISGVRPAGPLLARPHVVVARAVLDPDGAVAGALAGIIDLTTPEFVEMLSAVSTADGRFVMVADARGRVLASTSPTTLLTAPTPSADAPLLATVPFVRSSWRVVAGQAREPALAGTRQLQRILFALGVGGLGLAVAVGARLIRGFTRRVRALTDHAEIMARGDLSQPVAVAGPHDEVGTLAHTFEHMRVELQRSRAALEQRLEERDELIRLKEEFLANVSHELRTPLNVIIGYTDMLLDETRDGHDMLGRVRTQSERLLALVRDLMTLSGLSTGKLAIEVRPVAVPDLLARLGALADQLVQGKALTIAWECPAGLPVLDTDGRRLEQVLANLLSNACKFTPHGTVTVRVRHRVEQEAVVFEVSDTGIGIPPDELPHIFDEFRQVDGSMARRHDGIGLGLALVRKLTTVLGGTVAVTSRVGRGLHLHRDPALAFGGGARRRGARRVVDCAEVSAAPAPPRQRRRARARHAAPRARCGDPSRRRRCTSRARCAARRATAPRSRARAALPAVEHGRRLIEATELPAHPGPAKARLGADQWKASRCERGGDLGGRPAAVLEGERDPFPHERLGTGGVADQQHVRAP